jgi:tetratricopeptide (TPR) repeat protein
VKLRLRSVVAAAAAVFSMFVVTPARADGRAELEKARASFLARNWADAEERLKVLLDPKTGLKERPLISQARMYLGAALLSEGKRDEAKEVFEKLVLDDPSFEPDPLSFPGEAINTFIDVRASLLEEIRKASQAAARLEAERKKKEEAEREAQRVWLEALKIQASEEKITVRHSRVVACIPFGVGQFQNGQTVLGWSFLGIEAAALAGTAITSGMYFYARGRENDELNRPGHTDVARLSAQWHNRAEDLRVANLSFLGGFALFAAIGIIQANLAFVPETPETKKRDLPKLAPATAKVTPLLAPLPGGGMLGLQGFAF